ncbi:glycosyl hydrolase family 28-related protein, partial [Chitinophaga sp.]|uniref:glycosyl hydrolase family 28-related protein n=1 Tax=Chitinophaga sp. TaxID=1869181 RepID=UPI002BE877A7
MKLLSFIVLMFLTLSTSAQIYQNTGISTEYGRKFKRIKVDSTFTLPQDTSLRSSLTDAGAITYQISDESIYVWNGNKWNRIASGTQLALDSAYMRNDTMFFPITTGGELSVKVTSLPQANVNGLTDSLFRRPDSTQVILNQTKYAQPASFWIAKFGRIDSSLVVRRNVTGQVLPIVDVQNSGAFGGGIQLGNGTSSVSSFLPSIKGLVQRDTTQSEEFRSTIISSNYYSADTAGKSFSLRNTLPASGGLLIGSTNQTSPTLTVALHDNIFGVFTTVKNVDTDSATRTMRQTYSLRLGGDHNMQMKGRLAVGYPFVDTLGKQDQLITYLQKFPSGVAGMFNGKVVAKDATVDSNLVTYRQVNSVSVMQFGAKADGITNDSLAFAQAVATGAKRIYVPRGVYALSKVKLR